MIAPRISAPRIGIPPELADLWDADQAEVEDLDQDRSEKGADDGARAALDAHATDDGGGDRRQLEGCPGRDVDGAELSEEHEAGQAGERAAHDEGDQA